MAGRSSSLARWRRTAVRRVLASRAATTALVRRLPAAELVRPRTLDRWSFKDALAHLLACDEETVRRLRLIAAGRGARIQWFESLAHADRFNARSVARLRRLGVPAILRRRARLTAELARRLGRLPLASLRDPAHAYPVTEWLPAPGWSHEWDHAGEIRAAWRRRRARARA
jgi:hypothetical protein